MNNENQSQNNQTKKTNQKKIIVVVTTILILFLAANTYASTQGYNNIFFVIKKILTDREVIISYQYIQIDENTRIQVNKLTTIENETTLDILVDTLNAEKAPKNFIISDITDGTERVIAVQKSTGELEGTYTEKIELTGMKEETNLLQIEVQDGSYKNMITLEINLQEKEINITCGQRVEVEKISEVELKEILSKYAFLNFWKDRPEVAKYRTMEEYNNELKVFVAEQLFNEKTDYYPTSTIEDIHNVIREMTGEEWTEPKELANVIRTYNEETNTYIQTTDESELAQALCLQINDIIFEEGLYKVTFVYCYPSPLDFDNGTIEELPRYETTMQFKLNEEYDYTRYCLIDIDSVKGELIQEDKTMGSEYDEEANLPDSSEKDNITNNNNENTSENTINDKPENNEDNTQENTSTNTTVNVPSTSITETVKPNIKVDNYASTMTWDKLWVPGMRTQKPRDWDITEINSGFNGYNGGEVATIISGPANGINKETNEIIYSDMIITYYLPEFVDYETTEEYAKALAAEIGTYYGGTGYGTSVDSGIVWAEIGTKRATENDRSEILDYCHIERTGDGSSIAYRVRVESTNAYANYKTTNILNWVIPKITFTSF